MCAPLRHRNDPILLKDSFAKNDLLPRRWRVGKFVVLLLVWLVQGKARENRVGFRLGQTAFRQSAIAVCVFVHDHPPSDLIYVMATLRVRGRSHALLVCFFPQSFKLFLGYLLGSKFGIAVD